MTTPAVLKLPGGPKTRTEWQSSAASSRPKRPPVRPRITRPGSGRRRSASRSSRRAGPGGRPAAGRLPVRRARVAQAGALPQPHDPAGRAGGRRWWRRSWRTSRPGRAAACWAAVGQASAGSSRWWRSCTSTRATSAGSSSSQVWPKARPASCPVAHTRPLAAAPTPRPGAAPAADRPGSGCRGQPVAAGGQAASGPPPDTTPLSCCSRCRSSSSSARYSSRWAAISRRAADRPGLRQARLAAGVDGLEAGLARRPCGSARPLACGRARRGSGAVGDRRLASAHAGGACNRWTDSRRRGHRRRSSAWARRSPDSAWLSAGSGQPGYDQAASRGDSLGVAWPRGGSHPPSGPLHRRPREHGGPRMTADLTAGRAVTG